MVKKCFVDKMATLGLGGCWYLAELRMVTLRETPLICSLDLGKVCMFTPVTGSHSKTHMSGQERF